MHRDVKPENVLLTPDDFAYLVDFGIAHSGGDAGVTAGGALIGSCAYMATERFTEGRVGPQADVYSLACVLYECLTGRPPFEHEELQQLMGAHIFAPPPRPSIMRRGIQRAFDDVIARGMAKEPVARFSSAGELARAATEAASMNPGPAPLVLRPQALPPPTSTRPFLVGLPEPGRHRPQPVSAACRPHLPGRAAAAYRWSSRRRRGCCWPSRGCWRRYRFSAAPTTLSRPETPSAAPPVAPETTAPTTKTPSLSRPVQGADGLGFVGETARCDPGDPPAMVVRTALSLAVVCQTGPGSFYYRGERISDGANIELANAVRTSGGFDVTNPADGTRYEVASPAAEDHQQRSRRFLGACAAVRLGHLGQFTPAPYISVSVL